MNESQLDALNKKATKSLNQRMFNYVERVSHPFSKFQICNAYLVKRSISQGVPLFISGVHKDLMQSLIVPTSLVLLDKVLSYEAHIDQLSKIDDYMVINDGRMKLIQYDSYHGRYVLCYTDKRGKHLTPVHDIERLVAENIVINKKYYSAYASHEDRYEGYIKFFQHSYKCAWYPPFEHYTKALIVCPKKSVIEEMSYYKVNKLIPYAFISSVESDEEGASLRTDPALYFSSDYDAAVRFIEDNCTRLNISYLVVMHDAKVKNNIVNIRQDLAQKRFDNLVALSYEEIKRPDGSLHWRWSSHDINILTGNSFVKVYSVSCLVNQEFDAACARVYTQLKRLSEEYYGTSSLKPMFIIYIRWLRYKKGTYQDRSLELKRAIDDTMGLLLREGYDEGEVLVDLKILNDAFIELSLLMFSIDEYLEMVKEVSIELSLVVPHCDTKEWQDSIEVKGLDRITIIPDSLFPKVLSKIEEPKEFHFSFIPPYKVLEQLLSLPLQAQADIVFNVTKAEIDLLNGYLHRIRKQSSDSWEYVPEWCPTDNHDSPKDIPIHGDSPHSLSQLIDSSFIDIEDNNLKFYGDSLSPHVALHALDEHGIEHCLQLTVTTNVIRISGEVKQFCQVSDLELGDAFLLYSNPSKEHLYEILTSESVEFQRIEAMSNLWKIKLREYIETPRLDKLSYDSNWIINLIALANELGINHEYIEKSWLGDGLVVKYPQKRYLQKLVDLLAEKGSITREEKHDILAASRAFSSIMIKLGHNLSAEIHRIIACTTDENIAQYISNEVFNRDENYLCLSQFDEKAILALVKRNTPKYTIIRIEEGIHHDNV